MKKLLAIVALLALISCAEGNTNDNEVTVYPLKALSVQVGSNYYHAVIDQYQMRAEIGALEDDLNVITGVEYTLGSETATIMPDPGTFIGNWQKSQTVVIADNGKETAYDIVFTLYEEGGDTPSKPVDPEPGPEPEENIIFFEDFNEGTTPDPEIWKMCTKANSAWNQHFDNDRDWANEQLAEIDGVSVLVLTADKIDGNYSNGGIRTIGGFPVNTRVEVRARFEKAGGGFPAIWQMPLRGLTWPLSGEIDIMEWVQGTPNRLYHTIHTGTSASDSRDKSSSATSTAENTDIYRIYAVERTAEAVTFFVDGTQVYRYENKHLAGDEGPIQYPFATYEYDIILNYSLGGYLNGALTWPGAIKDSDLPAHMYVDWVKVVSLEE